MPVDENTSPEKGGGGDGDNGHLIPLPIRCTFERCQGGFDSSFDSASNFVVHLKNNHQLIVFQIFQVAPFLESYLNYYFGQDNRECNIRSKFYSSDGITHIGAAPENPNQLADAPIRFKLEHSLLSRFLKQQKEYLSLSLENERCFICDETPGGSYAEYLAHLEEQHKLVLGKAYNLVFLPEFISVLRCRLVDQLCCIFCNANFENIDKVKMHMVDKRHFRINPLDKLFDKYYFINYQNCIDNDANWSSSMDSDSSWGEWLESDTEKIKCLFEDGDFIDFDELIEKHLPEVHGVDFRQLVKEYSHSFYDLVKIINYLRERAQNGNFIKQPFNPNHLSKKSLWDHERYLQPILENDSFIRYLDGLFLNDDEND